MNTNMTLEKRILSVLLTVIMVFSMVPLSVFAADSNQASVTVNETVTEYATIQEAFDAAKKLTDPCTVKVLQSFKGSMVLGVTFTAEDNCDITLDVNGFDMYNRNTRDQASASMFTFEKGTNAHLTVVNNSENREPSAVFSTIRTVPISPTACFIWRAERSPSRMSVATVSRTKPATTTKSRAASCILTAEMLL